MDAKITNNDIPAPDWNGVRKIYKKLSDELHVLTSSFNIDFDKQTKFYLDHLILAIDEIDTCVDELPTKEERDEVTGALVAYLENNDTDWHHPLETPTLAIKIKNLKSVVQRLNIQDHFIGAAKTIFYNTEEKRHTKSLDELIDYIVIEGKATAILPLSILGEKVDAPFGTFFTQLCMLMGVADLIFDARMDFRKGLIAVKPNLKMLYRLFMITVTDGSRLLYSIPRKVRFLNYCIRFGYRLMVG